MLEWVEGCWRKRMLGQGGMPGRMEREIQDQ